MAFGILPYKIAKTLFFCYISRFFCNSRSSFCRFFINLRSSFSCFFRNLRSYFYIITLNTVPRALRTGRTDGFPSFRLSIHLSVCVSVSQSACLSVLLVHFCTFHFSNFPLFQKREKKSGSLQCPFFKGVPLIRGITPFLPLFGPCYLPKKNLFYSSIYSHNILNFF